MAVGRLPVEPATLAVGDVAGEGEEERRPLAVDRRVARARASEERLGRVPPDDERRDQQVERAAEPETVRDQPVHERLRRPERRMVRPVRLRRPPEEEHAMAAGDAQDRAQLARRAAEPMERAIEIQVMDAGRARRERLPDREPVERAAEVRARRARVHAGLRERGDDARARRRARRDRDAAVERGEAREESAQRDGQRARRIVQRRGERDVGEPRPPRHAGRPTTPSATRRAIRSGA